MRIKKLELGFPMFIQVRPADFWPTYYAQILIKLTFKGASWSKKNLWKESWPFCKGFLGKNAEKKLFLGAIGAQRGDSYWRTDSLTDSVICRVASWILYWKNIIFAKELQSRSQKCSLKNVKRNICRFADNLIP